METVTDFIFLGSKITADGDCSHEIKRGLLLGRKAMTNLDSILKSRDITLLTKVHLVKAMVFPVVMYGCESWTIKNTECEELMLLNCSAGEDSWESLVLQGDPTLEIKFATEQTVALSSSALLCSIYSYVSLFFIWNSLGFSLYTFLLPPFLSSFDLYFTLSPLFLDVIHCIKG